VAFGPVLGCSPADAEGEEVTMRTIAAVAMGTLARSRVYRGELTWS
jgi:hypothetical protein